MCSNSPPSRGRATSGSARRWDRWRRERRPTSWRSAPRTSTTCRSTTRSAPWSKVRTPRMSTSYGSPASSRNGVGPYLVSTSIESDRWRSSRGTTWRPNAAGSWMCLACSGGRKRNTTRGTATSSSGRKPDGELARRGRPAHDQRGGEAARRRRAGGGGEKGDRHLGGGPAPLFTGLPGGGGRGHHPIDLRGG